MPDDGLPKKNYIALRPNFLIIVQKKIRTNPDSQSDGLSDPNGQTGPKMDINLPKWIQMDLTGTKSN